jgi:NADH:ubiquinone oxidoreductase subunit C
MENLIEMIEAIPGAARVEKRRDGLWMDAPGLDVCAMAQQMLEAGARLSTVSAAARSDGETDLIYHFLSEGTGINLRTVTRGQVKESITPVLAAANWIEREIYDLYAVNFTSHPDLRRLVRPPELPIGFFRQPGGAASKAERKD